jgi:GNAT superfamily N-acetyltransferase
MPLHWSFLSEPQMSARLESEARELLVEAFPQHANFFCTASYRGSVPEYSLLGRAYSGSLCAHVECGRRVALVAGQPVRILGIGAVAVRPALQGQGLGREMFSELRAAALGGELADFGSWSVAKPLQSSTSARALSELRSLARACTTKHSSGKRMVAP